MASRVSSMSYSGPTPTANTAHQQALKYSKDLWGSNTLDSFNPAQYFTQQYMGTPSDFTNIPTDPIYSPQQVQEAQNAIWAQHMASAQGLQRQNRQNMASRFGSNSPLLQELNTGIMGRAMASGADQERQFGQRASEMNASHMLNSRQAQLAVEQARAADELARREIASRLAAIGSRDRSDTLSALTRLLNTAGSGRTSQSVSYENYPSPYDPSFMF